MRVKVTSFNARQNLCNYCKYLVDSILLYIHQEVYFIVKSCTDPQEYKVYNMVQEVTLV